MTFTTFLMVRRAVVGALCVGAVAVSSGSASISASEERGRALRIVKECSQYQGNPGEWCTITRSNLRQIPAGSRIFYTQPLGIPAGLLDTNIVLDAGNGNRAVGRCTLDLATARGLCTLSDGLGKLAGFSARVDVSFLGGVEWGWEGTYNFDKARD